MTQEETNEQIAIQWFEAFNDHNLEKLLALYNDNAKHYSPKLKIRHPKTEGWIVGKDGLRTWWQEAFEKLPTLHYKLNKLTANKERVFMEYTRLVEGEEDMLVAEVLDIVERIVCSRVYHGGGGDS
jgi:predicted SnoaL-like aldol condensation-catalyzing enzyme